MKAVFHLTLVSVSLSMLLSSCGLIGAAGRTLNRSMMHSMDDPSRDAMFESLREIHREAEVGVFTPREEDSTR